MARKKLGCNPCIVQHPYYRATSCDAPAVPAAITILVSEAFLGTTVFYGKFRKFSQLPVYANIYIVREPQCQSVGVPHEQSARSRPRQPYRWAEK
jgi:hypothetical protein